MSYIKDFVIENGVLTKYVGTGSDVVIPEGVTEIGDFAFSWNSQLTSITIPDGVTSIGAFAFERCEKLKSITIPNGVTSIGNSAFFGCTSLTSITIPDSVTNIGDRAFYWCQNLTSIAIPDSVTHIGAAAFGACPALAEEDGFVIIRNILYGYAGNATEVFIPDNVTAIDCDAFKNCMYIVSITIPDSVTSIGNSAFDDCRRLTSITIPNSVTSLGECIFKNCDNLTSITIPDSVTSIGDSVFHACSNLTSITIPDSVTSIGAFAFERCEKLKSITIPNGVTSIGNSAFFGCTSLTSITIPDSVTNINNYAFSNCRNLKSITFSNNLKEIGEGAFENCVNLRDWNFNEEITTFEGTALEVVFDYFFSSEMKLFLLEEFLFKYLDIVINNTSVNKKVKANKKKLLDLAVKNDNAELVEKLFNLYKKIPLDELNEYIDKAMTAPTLKAYLLAYKTRYYSVDDQEKHETEKLEKEFGIKERTLGDWKKIYNFETNGDTATITGYKGTDVDIVIPEKMGKYKIVAIGDDAFNVYASRIKEEQTETRKKIRNIVIPNSVISIGCSAFRGCKNLTEITIPNGITSIGREAFYDCENLKEIILSDSVTSIGEFAFKYCENLKEITIPNGITSIKKSTFSGCKSLISITIPDSVTNIDDGAFANCKQLKSVNIDFSKVKIGNDAFAYCDGLTDENGFFIKNGRLLCVRSDMRKYSIPNEVTSLDDNTMSSFNTPINLSPDIHKISYKLLTYYCKRANVVKLPLDLTTIQDAENCRGLCTYNLDLKKVQMPETITKIGSMAFKKCENLTEIHLREGITDIGEEAFAGSGLRKATIPSTVKHIPLQAFAGCSNLMVVNISEGVKTIEAGAFERCTALTEIYIPASVESIADGALPANKSKTIYAPAGSYAEQYAKENKIKVKHEKEEIDDNAIPFEYKISKDKTVKITAYVSDNPNLVIPAEIECCKVVGFNKGIFKNNKLITSVVWPAEIPVIPGEIFFGCSSIDNVVLPEGITEISEKAFRNCTNLTSIYIPASVTKIHEKAFECAKNTVAGWEYWTCVETIHGLTGSYAEQYAWKNNIPFIAE